MARRIRNLLCILLAVLLLAACSTPAVTDVMDDGADRFAAGKTEENYHLSNSALLLDELIDKYSGSYQKPVSVQLPEITPVPSETTPSSPTTPDSTTPPDATAPTEDIPAIPQVGSWSDFLRVMHDAYINTSETLEFEMVDGYTLDLHTALNASFTELQREDPIYVSCVDQWNWTSGNPVHMEIVYTMPTDELIAIKAETAVLVDEAVQKLDVAGKSDYEIVCAVNQYLIDVSYYPEKPYAPVTHTAYGALKNGVAVCEGYACAAKLMLNKLGIRTDIQVGVCTDGGGHAWNLVELDGEWYQLDVTWNDTSGRPEEFLLVNDDFMLKSRTWDISLYPACPNKYIK